MAGLTITLGRCSFCRAPASRTLRLVGGPAGPARGCRSCVNAFCAPIAAEPVEQVSITDVRAKFRKGVEQVVGREDLQTHFDLGIAYAQMGLLDEAISEFDL